MTPLRPKSGQISTLLGLCLALAACIYVLIRTTGGEAEDVNAFTGLFSTIGVLAAAVLQTRP